MEQGKIVFRGKTKTGKELIICYPRLEYAQSTMDYINKLSSEKSFILLQGEQKTLDEEKEWINSSLDEIKSNRKCLLFAFVDGKLIGVSDIKLEGYVKNHIGVLGISIDHEYRNQGIGKILIETTITESKSILIGLKIIILEVFGNNPIAQSLYIKNGFIEYGRLPTGIKHQDKFVDSVLMYKMV